MTEASREGPPPDDHDAAERAIDRGDTDRGGLHLLDRARSGDRAALEELLDRVRDRVESALRHRVGPQMRRRVEPSDILQSTYLRVVTTVPDFRGTSEREFSAWVLRILDRTLRKRLRFHGAQRRDLGREGGADAREIPQAGGTPSSAAVVSEELVRIAQAMNRLPKDYARILMLHMEPDQTHENTARILGRSVGASRVLLARARAALASQMAQDGGVRDC